MNVRGRCALPGTPSLLHFEFWAQNAIFQQLNDEAATAVTIAEMFDERVIPALNLFLSRCAKCSALKAFKG